MTDAEVFTTMCHAIWGEFDWPTKAADLLRVRHSTVMDWSSGRRNFGPNVIRELGAYATARRDSLQWAVLQSSQFLKTAKAATE